MRFIFWIGLCLVEAGLPVNGQDNTGKAKDKKEIPQTQQQEPPQGQPLGGAAHVNEAASDDDKKRKASDPDSYFQALIAPDNIPNVVLAAVGIVGIGVAIGTMRWLKRQTIAIRRQADTMEQQASDARAASDQQAKDIQASIAEAAKSARAMEDVALSMASNAKSVRRSVAISKKIAATQERAIELQSRPYLSVFLDRGFYQDANHVFEITAVIRNHGNTPAYDVSFLATLDIIPIPIPEGFTYPLTEANASASASLIAPGTTKLITRIVPQKIPASEVEGIKRGVPPKTLAMWGVVNYRDAFDKPRYVKFAFTLYWQPWLPGMEKDKDGVLKDEPMFSRDTPNHNEAN